MLIVCPSCSSRYNLPDDRIGAEGRLVRCAACRNEWFVMRDTPLDEAAMAQELAGELAGDLAETEKRPPADAAASAAGMWTDPADFSGGYVTGMGEEAADGAAAQPAPVAAQPRQAWWKRLWPLRRKARAAGKAGAADRKAAGKAAPGPKPAAKPAAARRPARAGAGKRRLNLGGSPLAVPVALLVASVTALALMVMGRAQVVAAAPSTARLFAAVGLPVNTVGLTFADVRSTLAREEAGRFLVVEAVVRNDESVTRRVPPIEIRLIGPDGRPSYTWTADPPRATLRPGDSLHFRTRLATPPETARSVQLRFGAATPIAAAR
jgi:predicted Zn finger-like uncharacterized protein